MQQYFGRQYAEAEMKQQWNHWNIDSKSADGLLMIIYRSGASMRKDNGSCININQQPVMRVIHLNNISHGTDEHSLVVNDHRS